MARSNPSRRRAPGGGRGGALWPGASPARAGGSSSTPILPMQGKERKRYFNRVSAWLVLGLGLGERDGRLLLGGSRRGRPGLRGRRHGRGQLRARGGGSTDDDRPLHPVCPERHRGPTPRCPSGPSTVPMSIPPGTGIGVRRGAARCGEPITGIGCFGFARQDPVQDADGRDGRLELQ